jgi:hypothetical protein
MDFFFPDDFEVDGLADLLAAADFTAAFFADFDDVFFTDFDAAFFDADFFDADFFDALAAGFFDAFVAGFAGFRLPAAFLAMGQLTFFAACSRRRSLKKRRERIGTRRFMSSRTARIRAKWRLPDQPLQHRQVRLKETQLAHFLGTQPAVLQRVRTWLRVLRLTPHEECQTHATAGVIRSLHAILGQVGLVDADLFH